jgi:hypothetical protein
MVIEALNEAAEAAGAIRAAMTGVVKASNGEPTRVERTNPGAIVLSRLTNTG